MYSVVAQHDNTVFLSELHSGNVINVFIGHTDTILAVSLSNNNQFVVTSGKDYNVKLFKTNKKIWIDELKEKDNIELSKNKYINSQNQDALTN